MDETTLKVAVITLFSVAKIICVVAAITFNVTVFSSVDKITFVVNETTFKVDVSTSSVVNIIFEVAHITFS